MANERRPSTPPPRATVSVNPEPANDSSLRRAAIRARQGTAGTTVPLDQPVTVRPQDTHIHVQHGSGTASIPFDSNARGPGTLVAARCSVSPQEAQRLADSSGSTVVHSPTPVQHLDHPVTGRPRLKATEGGKWSKVKPTGSSPASSSDEISPHVKRSPSGTHLDLMKGDGSSSGQSGTLGMPPATCKPTDLKKRHGPGPGSGGSSSRAMQKSSSTSKSSSPKTASVSARPKTTKTTSGGSERKHRTTAAKPPRARKIGGR